MSVLDEFFYVFKPKDEGVEKKVGDIEKKAKDSKKAIEEVNKSIGDFGKEASNALESILPGADKLIENVKKIGLAFMRTRSQAAGGVGSLKPPTGGTGAATVGMGGMGMAAPPAPPPTSAEGGAAGEGVSAAATAMGVAFTVAAVAIGVFVKAALEGAHELTESRKRAQEAGINSIQMAAAEQYAKRLRLSKSDMHDTLTNLARETQAGWVHAREFGNIFGLSNEHTAMLNRYGIRTTDKSGHLRNASVIFDDITKKMMKMPRDAAIAFGQFEYMTKDMATAIRDSGMTMSQFAQANQAVIEKQAQAIDMARAYEKAQQALSNTWDDFKIKVGGALIPTLTSFLNLIMDGVDKVHELEDIFRGLWAAIAEGIDKVKDFGEKLFGKERFEDAVEGSKAATNAIKSGWKNAVGVIKDSWDYWRNAGINVQHERALTEAAKDIKNATGKDASRADVEKYMAQKDAQGRKEFLDKYGQQTSDNDQSARMQLQAANLMKVATSRFALTTEQYYAMWAAKAGQAGGLRASGGVTPEAFRDIYKSARSQYAPNEEWAAAMYLRGAPYMAQLPSHYVQGMGFNPFQGPTHPRGLLNAKGALNSTNFMVPNAGAYGPGASSAAPTGRTTEQKIEVNTGPITISTQSSDPQAINKALSTSLVDQMKFTLNKLNDGQLA